MKYTYLSVTLNSVINSSLYSRLKSFANLTLNKRILDFMAEQSVK